MNNKDIITKIASFLLIFFFLGNDLVASVRAVIHFPTEKTSPVRITKVPERNRVTKNPKASPNRYNKENAVKRSSGASRLIFNAQEAEAYLGKHEKDPMGLPVNDFFAIEVDKDIREYSYAYLEYQIRGLEDGLSIPKSVNNEPVYTGSPVKPGTEWQTIRQKLDRTEIKQGVNQVRFSLSRFYKFPVTIKNVRLQLSNETMKAGDMLKEERIQAKEEDFKVMEGKEGHVFKLRDVDMPSIPDGIRNVSRNAWGYFYQSQSEKTVKVSIGVNKEILASGKSLAEVQIFYFNKKDRVWKPAHVEHVDMAKTNLEGSVPSNTNYFAGLITAPEMPEAKAHVPTAMSDIKAANPAAGMNIIQPPSISNTGEAGIQYPLEIPEGRNGMAPNLNLTYSSDAGTGWMGMGWNISIPSVSIDSRWGVPTFPTKQAEVYMLNGNSLVEEGGYKGNRNPTTRTGGDVRFFEHVQSSYKEIVRKGGSTSDYRWIETTANHTTFYYGTTDGSTVAEDAVLRNSSNASGDIVRWYLKKVKDKWGNFMTYSYSDISGSGGIKNGARGKVLSSIQYTSHESTSGRYSIEFDLASGTRRDGKVTMNLGFPELDDRLLEQIRVMYDSEEVKRFEFNYKNDDTTMFKTLLTSVEEYRKGSLFYDHNFKYYEGTLEYSGAETINLSYFNNSLLGDIPSEVSSLTAPLSTQAYPSPISTTTTLGWGTNGSIGVGVAPLTDVPNKAFTFSGRLGYSQTFNKDQYTLSDVNGDGLPDLIYNHQGKTRFLPLQRNGSGGLQFGNYKTVNYGGRLKRSGGSSFTYGFDFALPLNIFYFGMNWNRTKSSTSTYLTDYNADGISDVVSGRSGENGVVHFGRVDANGDIKYSVSSISTPNVVKQGVAVAQSEDTDEVLKDLEIVRVWEAPFDGEIEINGWAELLRESEDEVSVGVQQNNSFLIPMRSLYPTVPEEITEVTQVDRGDLLMFRVRANENGYDDLVEWNPEVEYIDLAEGDLSKTDPNGIDYLNSTYEDGFLLSAGEGVSFRGDELASVNWPPFSAGPFTDDVILRVYARISDPTNNSLVDEYVYKMKIAAGNTRNPIPSQFVDYFGSEEILDLSNIPGFEPHYVCDLSFEIFSHSNVKWKEISWRPQITITSGDCNMEKHFYPVVYYKNWNKVEKMDAPLLVEGPNTYMTSPSIDESIIESLFDDENAPDSYKLYFVTKQKGVASVSPQDGLGTKIMILLTPGDGIQYFHVPEWGDEPGEEIPPGEITENNDFTVGSEDNEVYAEFYTDSKEVAQLLRETASVNLYSSGGPIVEEAEEFNIYYRDHNVLQDYFLHWGQFCWSDSVADPILTSELYIPAQDVAENNDYSDESTPDTSTMSSLKDDMNPMDWQFFPLSAKRGENQGQLRDYIKSYSLSPNPEYLDRWIALGTHVGTYSHMGITAPGKLGEEEPLGDPESPSVPDPTYGASTALPLSRGLSLGMSWGSGPVVDSKTFTSSNYGNWSLSSAMDINGDGYPDILRSESALRAQVTDALGGYGSEYSYDPDKSLGYSLSDNLGRSISGKFLNEDPRFQDVGNSASGNFGQDYTKVEWQDMNGDGLADRISSGNSGTDVELNTGKGLKSPVDIGTSNHNQSSNLAFSLGASYSNMDNGFESTGMSFSGGIGLSRSGGKSKRLLIDLNGDGLPDQVSVSGGNVSVSLNTGTGFETYTEASIDELDNLNRSDALGISANVAGTYSFYVMFFLLAVLKVSISGGVQGNFAINKLSSSLRDMNGDGVLDFIETDNKGNLKIYKSKLGKQNLLKEVTNPLGGGFVIDYGQEGNKYGDYPTRIQTHDTPERDRMIWDMPNSKWVMRQVDVFDGLDIQNGSGEDVDGTDTLHYYFAYDGGVKSRRERSFLGFTRTETRYEANREEPIQDHPKIYITEVTDYPKPLKNDPGYRKRFEYMQGITEDHYTLYHKEVLEQVDIQGGGYQWVYNHYIKLMEHRENRYVYKEVDQNTGLATSNVVDWNAIGETQTVFPALSVIKKISVPQVEDSTTFFTTKDTINYDSYFNVKRYMQEASDPTTGMGDSIELEPMIVTSYEYDTLEFFFSDITNGNSPFDAGSIDPETGMVCHTISNSGFDPIDYCVPGHFDSNFIYNIKNNPCYDSSGLYTEATQFEIVFRKEVSDTIHRKRARYNTTYHGALIAVMEYYNPTMARNQTNMLKWHKVYFGSTDDDSLRRYVKVEALQDQKAPSLIWNYLNDEDYAETDVTYDDKGNVIEVIGPVNDDGQRLRVQYDYDTEVEQYVTHINNLSYGEERCMIYDYETGNLMEEKDVNGHSIAYRYDDKSRLVSVFGPREFEDPSSAPTMSFAYFPEGTVSGNGVPVAFTYHNMDVAEEPSGEGQGDLEGGCSEPADLDGRPEITTAMQTSTFMDGMQRVIQVKKDASQSGNIKREVSGMIAYDYLGREAKKTISHLENHSVSPGVMDFSPSSFLLYKKRYDYAGRIKELVEYNEDYDSVMTGFAYDWSTGIIQANEKDFYTESSKEGFISRKYKDVRGNIIGTSLSSDGYALAKMYYDPLKQLKTVKDPIGEITTYEYDNFGRTTQESHPDRGISEFQYDLAGNLIEAITAENPDGIVMNYDYLRLKEKIMPPGTGYTGDVNNVEYTYGSPGDGKNGAGRIVEIIQGNNFKTEEYKYDELGNLIWEYTNIGIPNAGFREYEMSYRYDSWGRMRWIKYPDNEQVEYVYTDAGELESFSRIAGPGGTVDIVSEVQYDGFGNIAEIQYGNNTHTQFTYNGFTRRLQYSELHDADGMPMLDKEYAYSDRGNVESIDNSSGVYQSPLTSNELGGGYNFSYTYDALSRLSNASGSATFTGDASHEYNVGMEYYADGRIRKKLQTHTIDEAPTKYDYDMTYIYNDENKRHQIDYISQVVDDPFFGETTFENVYSYNEEGSVTGVEINSEFALFEPPYYKWDEMQQLNASFNPLYGTQHYLYDQNRERILKGNMREVDGETNGEGGDPEYVMDSYTFYLNPYYVVTHYDETTEGSKHYYMGSQRVASSMISYIVTEAIYEGTLEPSLETTSGSIKNLDDILYDVQEQGLMEGFTVESIDYNEFLAIPILQEAIPFAGGLEEEMDGCEGDEQCLCEQSIFHAREQYGIACEQIQVMYWYHPDYLGNTEWVSNRPGYGHQYFWYSPWGEALHEDHDRGQFESRYLFNAKEQDIETDNYYYGMRYYDPQISMWLSVDRLAAKYPAWTPYNFTMNNPVNLIDPNGDSVKTSQEGYDIINQGLTSTLGESHPFGYDQDKGAVTFDQNFDRSKYNKDQLDVIDRYSSLVISESDMVNVSVVNFEENISEINQSLADRGAGGVTVPYSIKNSKTGERIGTEQNVYIARNPQRKIGTDPFGNARYQAERPYYPGLTSIHEIGGHAYLHVKQPGVSNHNQLVESFENRVRNFYMYKGAPIKGFARKH